MSYHLPLAIVRRLPVTVGAWRTDLLAVLSKFGQTSKAANLAGSTKIDIEDLLVMLGRYGSTC
jgi:hypothetical protein